MANTLQELPRLMANEKKKVLVVDDEPDVAELLLQALQSDEIDVTTAFDGLSALEALPELQPDLIVLDVMMPIYDGFQICQKIKSNPKTEQIKVVLFTAASERYVIERILEAGADDYITKPIDAIGIENKVREMLGLSSPAG